MAKLWLHQSDSYEITTEVYSGPLDLLLDLIQKAELDISKLALAQVTDQFLEYISANQNADPDYLSEFVSIAAKLVQIKSKRSYQGRRYVPKRKKTSVRHWQNN